MRKIYFVFAFFWMLDTTAQIISIPDPNFKSKLFSLGLDINNNGDLEQSEANLIVNLNVSNSNISNLTGINYFTNLSNLRCYNNNLTSLDVSGLVQLQTLDCFGNEIQNINLNNLPNLQQLNCFSNQIQSLYLLGLNNLRTLNCGYNDLYSLEVSGLAQLQDLVCEGNQLLILDLGGLTALQTLNCQGNELNELDLSSLTSLQTVNCSNNLLQSLLLKNGVVEQVDFSANDDLVYVCADENEVASIENLVAAYNYPNCHVNSYCSFEPGGNYITISGNSTFDIDNNGCDVGDPAFPQLFFLITNNNTTFQNAYLADGSGTYTISVFAGSYTLQPILENQAYFNISPSVINVNFSSVTHDFCITPNGVHSDLEIIITPLNVSRPGFDTTYKILYKNKGTHAQSGTINFTFDDAVLDFVDANPAPGSQSGGSLNWTFTDLLPFETRTILLTLNANSPIETPPLNGGDILNFTASVNNTVTDETPEDNTFTLNQTFVNSFDPNDKTCLEGNTVTPEMIGKYVHYMIRFENTGTANARNIVVKDMIDTTKFDISSLVPIDASHPFVTKISNTNKVEFIFQNIDLPFDDANNDGYVAFKIKTKPTLVLGNTFSNTASIYFDYNFPIVTNTATTTIALLANQDFEFGDYFKIYSVPVTTVLNIDTKKSIEVSSINIYNTLGQLVLVVPSAQQTKSVEVSSLKSGNYLVKINTDKGSATAKFVKL